MPRCPYCKAELEELFERAQQHIIFSWVWDEDRKCLSMGDVIDGECVEDTGGIFECPHCGTEVGDLDEATEFMRGED